MKIVDMIREAIISKIMALSDSIDREFAIFVLDGYILIAASLCLIGLAFAAPAIISTIRRRK